MENKYFQMLDLKTLSTKSDQLLAFQKVQYQISTSKNTLQIKWNDPNELSTNRIEP